MKLYFYKKLHADAARQEIKAFMERHSTVEQTLDVGGRNSPYKKQFPNRFCIDIQPGPDVDKVASVYELPFPDDSFPAVLCSEVFEHLAEPRKAAAEILRVLKPGGKLILTTRFLYPIHGIPDDFFRYTRFGLADIFKDFKSVDIEPELPGWRSISSLIQGLVWEEKARMSKARYYFLLLVAKIISSLPKTSRNAGERLASGYHVFAVKA
ncbi:MAG: class I SAM-dependent methyltransferase [Patescibacteria group bacterium]|nr:class I SAM-dependent methyltransferase [Patescibacteria group bacterium]MDE2116375.1 class I SAM-dependent methyltransferase [Patescibacteria group bacterium]